MRARRSTAETPHGTRWVRSTDGDFPDHYHHPSFEAVGDDPVFSIASLRALAPNEPRKMSPDDAKGTISMMHYAAHKASVATDGEDRRQWLNTYFLLRNHVVVCNLGLANAAALRFRFHLIDEFDLKGEAELGLIRAVSLFDPWHPAKFSAHAFTACRLRCCQIVNASRQLKRAVKPAALEDWSEDKKARSPEECVMRILLYEAAQRHLKLVKFEVVKRSFGLGGSDPQTDEQIASELGIGLRSVQTTRCLACRELQPHLGAFADIARKPPREQAAELPPPVLAKAEKP